MVSSVETQILQDVVSAVGLAAGAAITYLTAKAKQLIDSHVNTQQATRANAVLDGLSSIANTVVQDFNQRIVADAKANGGWTPNLAQTVKRDAMAAVKSQSSNLSTLGTSALGDVDELIASLVEEAILKNR